MEINLSSGIRLPQSLPGAKATGFPVQTPTQEVRPQSDVAVPGGSPSVEERRLEQVRKAAQSYRQNTYAVSDTRFTIYKDSTGQYITRYTSLRDGRVTYIPEPSLLTYMQNKNRAQEVLVELSA